MPRTYAHHPSYMLKNIKNIRYSLTDAGITFETLEKFYPNHILATRDIFDGCNPYQIITKLTQYNYLKKIDELHVGARYGVTLQGKCKILCKYFGIRFLCLCILTEAYFVHKCQLENDCKTSYVIKDAIDIFGDIFSHKTILNSAYLLGSKGFADRISKMVFRIKENQMKNLAKHEETLYELHDWILDVPTQLNEMEINEPGIINKIKNS